MSKNWLITIDDFNQISALEAADISELTARIPILRGNFDAQIRR